MARRLNRRTVIAWSAVASAWAVFGGVVLRSALSEEAPGPGDVVRGPGSVPVDRDAVDLPTDQPVQVVYCAGWDPKSRAPAHPMSERFARSREATGAQFAVVFVVSGKPRVLVEVCWADHHAEVWDLDGVGRRYRAVAYRRWPDQRLRLFEIRRWDYPDRDTPEFNGGEPTFRARVARSGTAVDMVTTWTEHDGGLLQSMIKMSEWPEPTRPPDDLPAPKADKWAGFAGLTGPATVGPGADTAPERFPWRPPRPLRPRYLTEQLTPGARFRTGDGGTVTISRVAAGTLLLPTGRLLVADPFWLSEEEPLLATVAPGRYPVEVFRLPDGDPGGVALCRVTITGAPVVSWELAGRPGENELLLGDGEFFGAGVDTGAVGLVDAAGTGSYRDGDIERAEARASDLHYTVAESGRSDTGTNMIVVLTGGDGSFPVWLGRAADESVSCFVVDILALTVGGARPL
jgi:Protein of unknown function (DUF4241)